MAATSTPTSPQTLLEAVNELLQAVRISGVMSLNAADLKQDAADAKQALDNASREIQKLGWDFNTEEDYTLNPDPTTGAIALPSNRLKVTKMRCTSGTTKRLVQRGDKLYDKTNHTYAISESVKVSIVLCLPYEELNEDFKLYVTAMAAQKFCKPKLPSSATFRYTDEFLQMAQTAAETSDVTSRDEDLKMTSPHFARMGRR